MRGTDDTKTQIERLCTKERSCRRPLVGIAVCLNHRQTVTRCGDFCTFCHVVRTTGEQIFVDAGNEWLTAARIFLPKSEWMRANSAEVDIVFGVYEVCLSILPSRMQTAKMIRLNDSGDIWPSRLKLCTLHWLHQKLNNGDDCCNGARSLWRQFAYLIINAQFVTFFTKTQQHIQYSISCFTT